MGASEGVVVVTGGARGIGAATVRRFAADGRRVAVLDIDGDGAARLATELDGDGTRIRAYACDVASIEAVTRTAERVDAELGEPEVLVTSAALIPNPESVLSMDLDAHDRMWRVNYHGTLYACRVFGQRLATRRSGAIVTLGSINNFLPLPLPAYNPGKVAVGRLTQLLAAELGRHGVRVNSVAPTYVMTPELQARVDAGLRDLGRIMAVHVLPFLPEAADVADAIHFLCSPAARCITGVTLPVDCGWSAGVGYMTYAGGVPWQTPADAGAKDGAKDGANDGAKDAAPARENGRSPARENGRSPARGREHG